MKLIKINTDHYIIVDDSGIKEGDWFLNTVQRNIYCNNIPNYDVNKDYLKKITHSTQPLESMNHGNYSSNVYLDIEKLSLQEVKELLGEVDVKKRAETLSIKQNGVEYWDWQNGFKVGYNQALEDNKDKKYTEEDIKKAWDLCTSNKGIGYGVSFSNLMYSIQSLQPKTEWEVEFVNGKLKLL